ncbi:MAG: OmpA family protein [Spirosomaceae bacterium]|nr:OmpA family protein [Spirosomataceae bacterium]
MMNKFRNFVFVSIAFLYVSLCFGQNEFRVGIEVRNKYTQRPVMTIISVLPVGGETELVGSTVGDAYVVRVKPSVTYQVLVASQDYKTYRQVHSFDPNTVAANGIAPFVVQLDPLNPPKNFTPTTANGQEHSILLFDKAQRIAVSDANITLRNADTKEMLPLRKNTSAGGAWMADLKGANRYMVEIKAPGYEPYSGTVTVKEGQPTEIGLVRALVVKRSVKYKAVDALTGKTVAARFKLTDEIKESYTGTTQGEGVFEPTVIVQKQPYTLTVSAEGYHTSLSKITIAEPTQDLSTQTIKLYKTDVKLTIKVIDAQTNKPLEANIKVINQTDKKTLLATKAASGAFEANPQLQYSIEVQAKDFSPYQQSLEKALANANANNELIVSLKKLQGDSYLTLSAIDAATKQPVAATFRVSYSTIENPTELKSSLSAAAKYKISEPDVYKIETIAAGYLPLKGEIDAEEMSVGQAFGYEAKLTKEPAKTSTVVPTEKPITQASKTTSPIATSEPPKAAPIEKRMFTFKIIDAQNRRNVPKVRVKITNLADNSAVTPKIWPSNVQSELILGQMYGIEVSADNYEAFSMKLDAGAWAKRGEFLTNISMIPLKKSAAKGKAPVVNEKVFDNLKAGQSLTIEDNVYFDQSSYILRPEAHSQLNRLVLAMKRNPKLKIEITGHTDNVGDPRLNLILSENRAKVISNYLIYSGIEEVRIIHKGAGQTRPLAPNDNEDNMRRNRRVEFVVKDV